MKLYPLRGNCTKVSGRTSSEELRKCKAEPLRRNCTSLSGASPGVSCTSLSGASPGVSCTHAHSKHHSFSLLGQKPKKRSGASPGVSCNSCSFKTSFILIITSCSFKTSFILIITGSKAQNAKRSLFGGVLQFMIIQNIIHSHNHRVKAHNAKRNLFGGFLQN